MVIFASNFFEGSSVSLQGHMVMMKVFTDWWDREFSHGGRQVSSRRPLGSAKQPVNDSVAVFL